jgi:hypothetical protein
MLQPSTQFTTSFSLTLNPFSYDIRKNVSFQYRVIQFIFTGLKLPGMYAVPTGKYLETFGGTYYLHLQDQELHPKGQSVNMVLTSQETGMFINTAVMRK